MRSADTGLPMDGQAGQDGGVISEAVVVWTGFGQTPSPDRDLQRLVGHFGPEVATEVVPQLRALEDDFYSSAASHDIADLAEATESAASEFRERHPGLSEDAVRALAWCYSYDLK